MGGDGYFCSKKMSAPLVQLDRDEEHKKRAKKGTKAFKKQFGRAIEGKTGLQAVLSVTSMHGRLEHLSLQLYPEPPGELVEVPEWKPEFEDLEAEARAGKWQEIRFALSENAKLHSKRQVWQKKRHEFCLDTWNSVLNTYLFQLTDQVEYQSVKNQHNFQQLLGATVRFFANNSTLKTWIQSYKKGNLSIQQYTADRILLDVALNAAAWSSPGENSKGDPSFSVRQLNEFWIHGIRSSYSSEALAATLMEGDLYDEKFMEWATRQLQKYEVFSPAQRISSPIATLNPHATQFEPRPSGNPRQPAGNVCRACHSIRTGRRCTNQSCRYMCRVCRSRTWSSWHQKCFNEDCPRNSSRKVNKNLNNST